MRRSAVFAVGSYAIHELPELMERLAAVETDIYNIRLKLASILHPLKTFPDTRPLGYQLGYEDGYTEGHNEGFRAGQWVGEDGDGGQR